MTFGMTFTPIASLADLTGELSRHEVAGQTVALARVGEHLYAFGDECTHLHCSLAEGELDGNAVVCPCHASEFDVRSGAVLQGPAVEPTPAYPVRVVDGVVEVALGG